MIGQDTQKQEGNYKE